MRESFWYKRGLSAQRDDRLSENRRPNGQQSRGKNQVVNPPDDSLKNQIRTVAYRLTEIAAEFEEIKVLAQKGSSDYRSSEQNVGEIRCHLHNSGIILYCVTDHRLLCSVCVFGSEFHKRHQIMEAAKAELLLQTDLRDNEKVLKPKISQIARQRNGWQELLEKLEDSYTKSIKLLEKDHEEITAMVALAYKKNKEKLEEVFDTTRQSLKLLISSYSSIVKAMRFQHPHLRVKHHFVQEVMDRKGGFENMLPNVKLGLQMVLILEKFGKNIAKTFKSQYM